MRKGGVTILCDDCRADIGDLKEYWFITYLHVWPVGARFLCVGCLEVRLGRELTSTDFDPEIPCNYMTPVSDRLMNRRGVLDAALMRAAGSRMTLNGLRKVLETVTEADDDLDREALR